MSDNGSDVPDDVSFYPQLPIPPWYPFIPLNFSQFPLISLPTSPNPPLLLLIPPCLPPTLFRPISPHYPVLNPKFQPAATYQQRVSTRSQLQNLPSLKNGYLDMKLEIKFHLTKWKRYFFKLRGKKLFYANNPEADIFYEIDLSDVIIAESGNKNKSCSFEVKSFKPFFLNFNPIFALLPLF